MGLTSSEARKLIGKHGPNVLPEKPPPSALFVLLSQFRNPLVYVLIAAGLITFFLRETVDTTIIFLAVAVNTVLGFVQEEKASRAFEALKKLLHPTAKVIRDGEVTEIGVEEVTVGDVVVLEQGSKIPAGGELLEANRLNVGEAILTGESRDVLKKVGDQVFMGTVVTAGIGRMRVTRVGEDTEIGKIAIRVQEVQEDTPLRKQLSGFSRRLTYLVIVLMVLVFVVGIFSGRSLTQIFVISVALAVSSIPEGLLVALTVVLAIGMQRIAKRRGLVRSLVSAETLGGVTKICVDKTGTLTEGKMRVVGVLGDLRDLSLQALVANDLDDPIVVSAWEWASGKLGKEAARRKIKKHERIDSIPFSSKNRFFASLNKWSEDENMIFVNGAPEYLLEWSSLSEASKREVEDVINKLTMEGKRIVGFARKETLLGKTRLRDRDVKSGLVWVGMLVFSDPVRKGVRGALEKAQKAGVDVVVITGDYPKTAKHVMDELGIPVSEKEIILGSNILHYKVKKLSRIIAERDIRLFARTTPEQKLKIVEALKRNGEVVAMMGDGVNDAPALKRADIGIVVGSAADVAKEAADLVLLDSNFATIISAIEEGRGIFDNIRKIILYLMSDAFEEIVAVMGAIILGFPLPVTAAQILWINLISDGLPDLALTVDPKLPGIMKRKPRSSEENIVALWMKELIGIVSVSGGLMALGLFSYFWLTTGNLTLSRSIAFASLGINSLVYVFSVRTLKEPFWRENLFGNKWLNLAVFGGLILQFLPFVYLPLSRFLGVEALSLGKWALVFLVAGIMFIMIEGLKYIFRRTSRW